MLTVSECRERHEWLEEFEQDWGSVDEWHSEIGSLGCVSPYQSLLMSLMCGSCFKFLFAISCMPL